MNFRTAVLNIMADGALRSPYQIWCELKDRGFISTEQNIASACASLCKLGKLTRVRKNLYQAVPV